MDLQMSIVFFRSHYHWPILHITFIHLCFGWVYFLNDLCRDTWNFLSINKSFDVEYPYGFPGYFHPQLHQNRRICLIESFVFEEWQASKWTISIRRSYVTFSNAKCLLLPNTSFFHYQPFHCLYNEMYQCKKIIIAFISINTSFCIAPHIRKSFHGFVIFQYR